MALTTAVVAAKSAARKRAIPGRRAGREEGVRIALASRAKIARCSANSCGEEGRLAGIGCAPGEPAEGRAMARRRVAADSGPAAARPGPAPPRRTAGRSAAPAPAAASSSPRASRCRPRATRASKVSIDGGGERAPPERVEAAAIELVAGVGRVGLAGPGLFPQAGRLVRLDAAAADAARQQAARGEGAVADLLGEQALRRAAGEQRVLRVARRERRRRLRRLPERRRSSRSGDAAP